MSPATPPNPYAAGENPRLASDVRPPVEAFEEALCETAGLPEVTVAGVPLGLTAACLLHLSAMPIVLKQSTHVAAAVAP